MFANLIESSPKPTKSAGQVFLSLVFHIAVGAGAVEASRRVIVPATGPTTTPMFYVVPEPPVTEKPPETQSAPIGPVGPADPIVVAPPIEVPIGIPPSNPGLRSIPGGSRSNPLGQPVPTVSRAGTRPRACSARPPWMSRRECCPNRLRFSPPF